MMKDLGLYRHEEREFIELYVCALILMSVNGEDMDDVHERVLELRDEIENDLDAIHHLPHGSIH